MVNRDGLYYPKFSDVPFTGEVTGKSQGNLKNGKREGDWVEYYDNGQLLSKGNYKNGKKEGVCSLLIEKTNAFQAKLIVDYNRKAICNY